MVWWQVDADAGPGLGPDAAVGRRVARATQHHAAAVLQVYATHKTRTVPSKLPQTSTHFAESIPANALMKLARLVCSTNASSTCADCAGECCDPATTKYGWQGLAATHNYKNYFGTRLNTFHWDLFGNLSEHLASLAWPNSSWFEQARTGSTVL